MKKCNKCGETKPKEFFPKIKKAKDGYLNFCKQCRKEQIILKSLRKKDDA